MAEVKILGTLESVFESSSRVYDKDGLCPTLSTCGGGGQQPKVIIEKEQLCVAMRGRGMDNEQTLEPNTTGCTNALTTVQKDNLVIEKTKCIGGLNDGKWGGQFHQQDRVYKGDIALALPANIPNGSYNYVVEDKDETLYRIRKLTPRECWRLMGYTDEDYDKAEAVVSNTQLYKQAGNAIVKQVLMAIFKQML